MNKVSYPSPIKEIFDQVIASSAKKLNIIYEDPNIRNVQTSEQLSRPSRKIKETTKQRKYKNNKKLQ